MPTPITAQDISSPAVKQRVYPVGRLDYHSSGLMILTNDGELANFLMARASAVPRSYLVKVEGRPEPADIAPMVLFFASPLADFVNGQILQVDGGR